MTAFEQADAVVAGTEAGYSADPSDRGNWTGGAVGAGELRGTKYGIAAAAHPDLDIANLTLAQAQAIRKAGYWDKVAGDQLPPGVALVVYDAAINNGPAASARWLQMAAGVEADGDIGPVTLAAVASKEPTDLIVEHLAQRMNAMARDPQWATDGLGWSRRLARLPFQSLAMTAAS